MLYKVLKLADNHQLMGLNTHGISLDARKSGMPASWSAPEELSG